jgi:XTP/dITP diphosphohydrolase
MNSIVLATTNQHKVKELSRLLDGLNVPCQSLADFPHVSWVVEDGQTLLENACKKAIGYAQQLSAWVLADDTGLEVNALDGAPGIRSARYAGDHATMAENRAKLLADLATIPESLWSARFVCHLAMANPAGELVAQAMGECMGRLRREPAGEFGFGYDVLFEVTGYGKTLAQLAPDVVDVVGHRAQAVKQLLTRIA